MARVSSASWNYQSEPEGDFWFLGCVEANSSHGGASSGVQSIGTFVLARFFTIYNSEARVPSA